MSFMLLDEEINDGLEFRCLWMDIDNLICMEVIFGLRIVFRSKIKYSIMLGCVKLGHFRNGDSARLTKRSMEVPNVRCRSFDMNTKRKMSFIRTSTEHSMVMQNDHFAFKIALGVF
jgi:hypothetical protein